MTEKRYLIWSQEHGAWWGRDAMGYTRSILNAGRYSQAEAQKIVKGANAHLPPGDFNEIEVVDPVMNQQEQIASITFREYLELKERIAELEGLMSEVMKWLDVSVAGREAAELYDRMEDLLLAR